ncbi:MAG TPA: hypothetical protein VIU11_10200 [Nakamurella sp.]
MQQLAGLRAADLRAVLGLTEQALSVRAARDIPALNQKNTYCMINWK